MDPCGEETDFFNRPVDNDTEALLSFDAPLFICGDDDNTFHAKNQSMTDWQRRIVVERLTKATTIQCYLIDVLHGKLNQTAQSPLATLMVFKFRLEPIKHGRRLVRARVDIEFFSKDSEDEPPTVLAVGLDDRWTINPTVDHEDLTTEGRLNFNLSGVPFVGAGAEVSVQKTVGRDISDATTITGGTHFGEGIDSGNHTACGWTLLENEKRKTGLPYCLTVPVLLQRQDDTQFNASVNLAVKGNKRTTIDWMFSKIPVDDPILFNPTVDRLTQTPMKLKGQMTGKADGEEGLMKSTVQKYAKTELGQWETRMDELTHVFFRTVYRGAEIET